MLINAVAPFAGAWIEMTTVKNDLPYLRSLPSRERGLKLRKLKFDEYLPEVAPFAGAWIEMITSRPGIKMLFVAPFAGAWIEMYLGGMHDGL